MKTNKKELLDALSCIKPAIAGKSPLIGLDHAWFQTDRVYAYNGVICIDTPLQLDFDGGLNGDILTKFISSAPTEEVNFDRRSDGIMISSGKARLTLPILSLERSVRDFPAFEVSDAGSPVTDEFCESLRNNLLSVSNTSALAAYSGVLLIESTDGLLNLFSTDSKTIAWERIEPFHELDGKKILLPGEFCTQLLKLHEEENYLLLDEGYAAFETGDKILLISRLLDSDGTPNYMAAINRHLRNVNSYYKVPDELKAALERCELVKPERGDDPIHLLISGNTLDLYIDTMLGSVNEQIEIKGNNKSIEVVLDSSLLLRALGRYTEFAVTEGSFILRNNDNSYHLISTMNS